MEKKTDKNLAELTLLSTPRPISSSTVTKKKSPEFCLDSSFGIISIKSDDLDLVPDRLDYITDDLQIVRQDARKTLSRGGLPSIYLKPTTNFTTLANNTGAIEKSASTINESDLVFSKNSITSSSTPRCSNGSNTTTNDGAENTTNVGEAIAKLSTALLTTEENRLSLDQFAKEFQKTMSLDSFKPGEEMYSQLQQDEIRWHNENSLPVLERKNDFTATTTLSNSKVSMGAFFYKKSDDLGNILAKSPNKQHKPVPLIDLSTIKDEDSWSISKIKQILTETHTTPSKAIDILNKPKKKFRNYDEANEKENIDSNVIEMVDNQKNVRIESPDSETRSSSSLSQLSNGKLPIETTNRELIWDCVKIGKDISQQFSIRNKSNSKLRIQCSLSGHAFKIKETSDLEYRSIIKIILHSNETKTIFVRLSPMSVGVCIDEINFQSIDLQHEQLHKQSIKLYGYGGCGIVSIINTFKDVSGKLLLSLGTIDNCCNQQVFKQSFLLRNSGNLATFALCNFQLKTMYKFANIEIKPHKLVLMPQQEQIIEIVFEPTRVDLKYITDCQQFVIDLGVITLITGTEVNRGRIRRLCRKFLENNQNLDSLCQQLQDEFPNESIPNDLKSIKESVQHLEKLLTNLNKQEITIILENDCDSTIVNDLNDHTITFHSFLGNDDDNNTQFIDIDRKLWKIEPNVIILTKQKLSDIIVITSISNKLINYEILSTYFNELDIEPKFGQIAPNQNLFIGIKLRKMLRNNQNFNIVIKIDEDIFPITIKVLL